MRFLSWCRCTGQRVVPPIGRPACCLPAEAVTGHPKRPANGAGHARRHQEADPESDVRRDRLSRIADPMSMGRRYRTDAGVKQVQGYVLAQGILQWPHLNTNAESFADVLVYKALSLLDT